MAQGVFSDEEDTALRADAIRFLELRTNDGAIPITRAELAEFTFKGEPFPLIDRQRGIRKPAVLRSALSISTKYTRPGQSRPYDDQIMSNSPVLRYKWRGTDPDHPENRAIRDAWLANKPLIWFFGVDVATFLPVFPVFIIDEEPDDHQFVVALDPALDHAPAQSGIENLASAAIRRYVMAETVRRVHQPLFRANIMRAYKTQCAVCAIAHGELLDAAHIIPDSHPDGVPETRNGLALCKIHHAAYDSKILGVTPDLEVCIREDILNEIDGPMLEYGLKGLHGHNLMVVPSNLSDRPDPDLLATAYERFRAVG